MFEALLAFFLTLGGFNSFDQLPANQQDYLKADCNCNQIELKSGADQDTWKAWCLEYEAKDNGIITVELGAS